MNTIPDTAPDSAKADSCRPSRKLGWYLLSFLLVLLLGGGFFAVWNRLHWQEDPETANDPQTMYQKGLAIARRSDDGSDGRKQAFALMKDAAESGSCPDAAYDAGFILAFPEMAERYGVEQDSAEGLRLLEFAATNGHAKAAGLMALWYSDTDASRLEWPDPEGGKDWDRAVEFAEAAANAKNPYGYFVLGNAYEFGRGTGKEVDMSRAEDYFRLAAEKGKKNDPEFDEALQRVKAKLAEPKPPVSATTRPGLLGGTVLRLHNRSATQLVGRFQLKGENGRTKAYKDVAIKPNGKVEIGQLELNCELIAGDSCVVRFDGHAWFLHVELQSNAYRTWFECGK